MIELLAAVTALALQLLFEVACFVFWDIPRWLINNASPSGFGDAEDDGRVYESDAVASLVARGVPEDAARGAVHGIMQRANIVEGLQGLGVPKVEAGRIATLALKKPKAKG